MNTKTILGLACTVLIAVSAHSHSKEMDDLWGESSVKLRAENAERGELFADGNYAMFIHWGLYSQLANKVDEKTYYGIGEWIMSPRMAGIPVERYKQFANEFNPVKFDGKAIAQLAKDAGMKYIVITAKHHDGFAMYDSDACDFDIVDATPLGVDPMKSLSVACREAGLGFGFYYSHSQDWTYPGGRKGPATDQNGEPATFDDYFTEKCLPQVEELTTRYGPIDLIWFDTPGGLKKEYAQQLVNVVRKNQPKALVSGRVGHDLGDYQTLGDMEVPHRNIAGMWESVDTTNDSWAYAWYDNNWKTPKEILRRLIACVGRGGTYMLNVGPDGKGEIPERATRSLRAAGEWIRRYPQAVYAASPSPWEHALPWGDVTVRDNRLSLFVFDWPVNGRLHLPGLKTAIKSASLVVDGSTLSIDDETVNGWTVLKLPNKAPDELVSVIQVDLEGAPEVDPTFGIDPNVETELLAEFAQVDGATVIRDRWMEKFGEWVLEHPATQWTPGGQVVWEVDVLKPGDYEVDLTYSGEGRLVWGVDVEGGEHIQNQQNASHVYHQYPIGWLNFPAAGRYRVAVSCLEGDVATARLRSIHLKSLSDL